MCELFAANALRPQELNAQLTTFFGDSAMHPHGWGLAVRRDDGSLDYRKEAKRAADSELLRGILAKPVRASHLLAHIRFATMGCLSCANCHPFVGTDAAGTQWAFVHNGSIFDQALIAPFAEQAQGTTDSERVLLYLLDSLDRVEAAGDCGFAGRFGALAQAVAALSCGNKLNFVLDDGACTYAHTNTEADTLYWRRDEGRVLLCTRPLDDEGWEPLPKRRLFAFRDGEAAAVSEEGGELYRYDEGQLRRFLLANAA